MEKVRAVFREANKNIFLLEIFQASILRLSGKYYCKIANLTKTEKYWRRFFVSYIPSGNIILKGFLVFYETYFIPVRRTASE